MNVAGMIMPGADIAWRRGQLAERNGRRAADDWCIGINAGTQNDRDDRRLDHPRDRQQSTTD